MKLTVLFALAWVMVRWALAIAALLAITWAGWQCFLHFYMGLPSISLLEIIGFYCCMLAASVVISAMTEGIRSRE